MIDDLSRDCFAKLIESLNSSEIDNPEVQKSIEIKQVRVIELSKAFEI